MKKRKTFLIVALSLVSFSAGFCSRSALVPNDPWDNLDWELFTDALIHTESKGNPNAVGDSGKAVGVLQIWPIMVKEANRLAGTHYTNDDRYDRTKSIEIFNIVQNHYNPDHDPLLALKVWNRRHPDSYREETFSKYEELFSEAHSGFRLVSPFHHSYI